MLLMVLSRSEYFTKDEVEGKTESVVMEAVGPDHVFVYGYMMRKEDWLGL